MPLINVPGNHKLKMKILEKIWKESSVYFKQRAIQKQQANKIVSLNEWYARENNRNKNN